MTFTYPAIFTHHDDGSYSVRFPDLEECKATGANIDEAIDNAIAEERIWIQTELEDEGADLPYVSDHEDLELADNEEIRDIAVIIKLMEGYD